MNTENTKQEIIVPTPEEVEKELMHGEHGLEEASQIPLDHVEPVEAYLLRKYQDKEPLTIEEEEQIFQILRKYRPAIQKIQPETIIENYTQNVEFQNAKDKFLQLSTENTDIETITMNYPHTNKIIEQYTFDVHPLTDSNAVLDIQENLSIFKDLTDEEIQLYTTAQTDTPLTREEQIIWQGLQDKIEKIAKRDETKIMREYLSLCLTFHDEDCTRDEMLTIFNHMKPVYVALLFTKVQEIQHADNVDLDKVFPNNS